MFYPTRGVCTMIYTNNSKHYTGEIGSIVIVNTDVDLTTATTVELHVKKPDGTVVVWIPTVYTIQSSEPNQYLRYLTLSGDLDQAGKYYVQPYVVFPTWSGYGATADFLVYNLFY